MKTSQSKKLFIRSQWFILIGLTLLCCTQLFLNSCRSAESFTPSYQANPWKDDYTSLSKMEHYQSWGTYNVHDPACRKVGDTYYMYSTDAIFAENKKEAAEKNVPMGFIQVRKSNDLIHWDFVGWAFPEIPQEAVQWVHQQTDGKGADNIWAPYMIPYGDGFRLYYSVSAFGLNTSYIGMAEGPTPEGPWTQKGCVVKTKTSDAMNAVDPSIIEDKKTGKWWMHYGSYFGGLFCVEVNPETGLAMEEHDKGHLIARRANYEKDNLEAPEIMYNAELDKYYLFTSYDPLMTTYNVRVAYANTPDGPFYDMEGNDIKDTTNNVPVITAPYRFDNHNGWAGTGHCGVVDCEDGTYFMVHQGRLSPENHLMNLHVRQIFFTENGWPVVSPQRYLASQERKINKNDLVGKWEIIRILPPPLIRDLSAGQILWGEGSLKKGEQAESIVISFENNGKADEASWNFNERKQLLNIISDKEAINNLIVFTGHDWENEKNTLLLTGLDENGYSVWGKKVQ